MLTKIIIRFDKRERDELQTIVVFFSIQLEVHTLINDVFSNLRAAAEANTLLGNDYVIDVNSVTLRDRKSR